MIICIQFVLFSALWQMTFKSEHKTKTVAAGTKAHFQLWCSVVVPVSVKAKQSKNRAAALIFVHRLQRRRSAICTVSADRQLRSRWCQWFLYLLHHLYRGRSWSGEWQRRSPPWKCQPGQLATTDDNNNNNNNRQITWWWKHSEWSGATGWNNESERVRKKRKKR